MAIVKKIFGQKGIPDFTFPVNGDPYFVDGIGGKNQIDAAKASRINHVVLVSSMGGTQPDHFLNSLGKREGDDKSGNILHWKRETEKYLLQSGLSYTIIHPGGLTDSAGGQAPIAMGFDDQMLERKARSIPREDVAEVCFQSLGQALAINRSFDIVSEEMEGAVTNWDAFFAQEGNNQY